MKKIIFALFALASITACKKDDENPEFVATDLTGSTTVSGQLYYQAKNALGQDSTVYLANRTVTVVITNRELYPSNTNAGGAKTYTATTDANGNYTMTVTTTAAGNGTAATWKVNDFVGTTTLTISGATRETQAYFTGLTVGITLFPGQDYVQNRDFTVTALDGVQDPTAATLTGTITRQSILSTQNISNGTYSNAYNTGTIDAAGVEVKVYSRALERWYTATTDADGNYTVDFFVSATNVGYDFEIEEYDATVNFTKNDGTLIPTTATYNRYTVARNYSITQPTSNVFNYRNTYTSTSSTEVQRFVNDQNTLQTNEKDSVGTANIYGTLWITLFEAGRDSVFDGFADTVRNVANTADSLYVLPAVWDITETYTGTGNHELANQPISFYFNNDPVTRQPRVYKTTTDANGDFQFTVDCEIGLSSNGALQTSDYLATKDTVVTWRNKIAPNYTEVTAGRVDATTFNATNFTNAIDDESVIVVKTGDNGVFHGNHVGNISGGQGVSGIYPTEEIFGQDVTRSSFTKQ